MDNETDIPLTVLDQMVSDDSTQFIKAAIPYIPRSGQRLFSIFAKFTELQKTMQLFSGNQSDLTMCSMETAAMDPLQMLGEISQYCKPAMREQLSNLAGTLTAVSLFQSMQAENGGEKEE